MSTIYGESPEIQMEDGYSSNGGVALYSADNNGAGTITSSNQDGGQPIGGRILWTITYNGGDSTSEDSYTGGITAIDWICAGYLGRNPFADMSKADIWNTARSNGNLDTIFEQLTLPESFSFAFWIAENRSQCISGVPY